LVLSVTTWIELDVPSQIGRGEYGSLRSPSCWPTLVDAVELEAAAEVPRTARLGLAVPVPVGGHDREVLLARVLDRVVSTRGRHVGVDAVFLAAVVAADASEAFARRRGAGGNLLEQLREPLLLLAAGSRD
jgi:hypothetical protein